jgi:hypothetical protein
MQVKALRAFSSTTLGEVEAGQLLNAPEAVAERMIASGYVEAYETKVVISRPTTQAAPAFASQAAQVSTDETPKPSAIGGRSRKTAK